MVLCARSSHYIKSHIKLSTHHCLHRLQKPVLLSLGLAIAMQVPQRKLHELPSVLSTLSAHGVAQAAPQVVNGTACVRYPIRV